jgi:hypothetical protein
MLLLLTFKGNGVIVKIAGDRFFLVAVETEKRRATWIKRVDRSVMDTYLLDPECPTSHIRQGPK